MADKTVQDWMLAPSLEDGQAAEEQCIINDMAGSIDLGVLKFANVISDLQPFIGDDQEDLLSVRRGLTLLASILERMTPIHSRPEISSLIIYFCTRLENHDNISNFKYGLEQVADSLLALSEWKKFPPADATTISAAVFFLAEDGSSTFSNQNPATRLKFFKLLAILVERFEKTIQRDMTSAKFVTGLVELAKPEKSALCLKILFGLYADIGRQWEMADEEYSQLWTSFMRYFPINMGVQSRNETLPQPEELKQLLLDCIVSSDRHAKEAFKLLLEDYASGEQSANKKMEILTTLYTCITSYSASTILEWAPGVWDTLKFEVWSSTNEEFAAESLKIINALVKSLNNASQVWGMEDGFSKFVSDISREIFERLSDMSNFVATSGKLLFAISSASPYDIHLVVKSVLPGLITLTQAQDSNVSKKPFIGILNSILQARVEIANDALTYATRYQGSASFDEGLSAQQLEEAQAALKKQVFDQRIAQEAELKRTFSLFREPLVDIYFGAMSELSGSTASDISLALIVIEGLVALATIPTLLSFPEKGIILKNLNNIITDSSKNEEVHRSTVLAIREISSHDPYGFKTIIIPHILKSLPGSFSVDEQTENIDHVLNVLNDLVQIGCGLLCFLPTKGITLSEETKDFQRNHDELQKALFAKLESVLQHQNQLKYVNVLLAAIIRATEIFELTLQHGWSSGFIRTLDAPSGPYFHIILPLLRRIVQVKEEAGRKYIGLQNLADETESFDDISITLVGKLLTLSMLSENFKKPDKAKGEKDEQQGSVIVYKKCDNILTAWDKAKSKGEPSAIVGLFCENIGEKEISSIQFDYASGPLDKSLVAVLSMSLLSGVDPKDPLQSKLDFNVGDVATAMVHNAAVSQVHLSNISKLSSLWILQLLVNKFVAGAEGLSILQVVLDLVDTSETKSDEEADEIFRVLAYYSAASLAAYSAEPASRLIERLIKGVENEKRGLKVAQSFRIILAPSEVLNKKNFCIIRPLRKGRFFEMTAKRLIQIWRENPTKEIKANALVALAGVLGFMEPSTLAENVDLIFPAVLEGTNVQKDEWAKATFIQIIQTLVPLRPATIESHLDSVIARMTDRTHNTYDSPSDSSVRCRALALEVLTLLTEHINPILLAQRKFKLMGEVDVTLDDCSREDSASSTH